MIAEPYICTRGPRAGEIESGWMRIAAARPETFEERSDGAVGLRLLSDEWVRYADFEREKLSALGAKHFHVPVTDTGPVFFLTPKNRNRTYRADELIGYTIHQYEIDSESSRLLKRAEFLKAVCEKEGVEWLPEEEKKHRPGHCWCGEHHILEIPRREPERDYYTKEEIDQKIAAVLRGEDAWKGRLEVRVTDLEKKRRK